MVRQVEEMENGNVKVRVRSRRGTGTRDEDEVIVEAVFQDLDEAESQSERINSIVEERVADARGVGDPAIPDEQLAEDTDSPDVSKIYLGDGSNLEGWIPIPREVVFEQIAPLVSNNRVEDDELPGVKINFSSDIPISGWNEVAAEVVSSEIEPIIEDHRLD